MPVNDCENNCTLKTRVDRLEKDFEAEKETNSQRHAEFYSRIGNCERVQAVSGTRLDTDHGQAGLYRPRPHRPETRTPSKRWETVVAAIDYGARYGYRSG